MQTFVLPDVLEDLCSPANLRYQARRDGRYLRKMDKRGIGTLSFVRASSEPVISKAFLPGGFVHLLFRHSLAWLFFLDAL